MILVRGRTVDETAGHVIKSSALLSLEQTLKECGELLLLRQDSNLADALVGGPCSSLPALLDFWAFGKHTRRSAARAALSSLAASVHHHSTYTQHPRVRALARALGVGDGKLPRTARRAATRAAEARTAAALRREGESDEEEGEESEEEEEEEDQKELEPPAYNARVFAFFCAVLEQLLPTQKLLGTAFATTQPVHIPCETDALTERPSAFGQQRQAVDGFVVILSLTELNELHFEKCSQIVERLRPSLVPLPVGDGAYSGVALPLDALLDAILDVYSELERERKARLHTLFRKHDLNGDGVLSFDEFSSLALDFNPTLSAHDVSKLFISALDESDARRKRGIDASASGGGGGEQAAEESLDSMEDVISAEAFAEVVERFSVQLFSPHALIRAQAGSL
ncbi:hypothetical protein T492DRAFT_212572 [Pavlovales sp. CCMP2436]|nr:hypothetical protein T492DRAFT_212572 [Pavlovales sp. CCMP2436]